MTAALARSPYLLVATGGALPPRRGRLFCGGYLQGLARLPFISSRSAPAARA